MSPHIISPRLYHTIGCCMISTLAFSATSSVNMPPAVKREMFEITAVTVLENMALQGEAKPLETAQHCLSLTNLRREKKIRPGLVKRNEEIQESESKNSIEAIIG
ncbi:hypothetical protein GOODEAATRI_003963 [Goodea atripinnis]|uniref:Uncharacterized protein n=1 Tax=Goodea atripinnis TaxID=208336 RepID=A0ABV0NJP2_9TELE